jgi:hypothetical protein
MKNICQCCGKEHDESGVHICDHDDCYVIVTAKKLVLKLEAENKRLETEKCMLCKALKSIDENWLYKAISCVDNKLYKELQKGRRQCLTKKIEANK